MTKDAHTEAMFRLQRLRDGFTDLEEYVMGADTPVMPFITDADGKFSSGRAEELLASLTSGLYRWYPDRDRMEEFYRCLLYCTLRACTTPYTRYYLGGSVRVNDDLKETTFRTLLYQLRPSVATSELEEKEEDQFLIPRLAPVRPWLYEVMGELYSALTGKALSCPVMRGTGCEMPEAVWEIIEGWMEDTQEEQEPAEEGASFFGEETEISQEENDRAFREHTLRLRRTRDAGIAKESARLRGCFACPEEYVKHYERLVGLFPTCYRRYCFEADVKEMTAQFLLEQGYSRLDSAEPCQTFRAYLNKAMRTVRERKL